MRSYHIRTWAWNWHCITTVWTYNWFCWYKWDHNISELEQETDHWDSITPEHEREADTSSSPVFSGVRVARYMVLCVCFVDRCLSFCPFSFDHCVVSPYSIYGFWLPLWYLHILLTCGDQNTTSPRHCQLFTLSIHFKPKLVINIAKTRTSKIRKVTKVLISNFTLE